MTTELLELDPNRLRSLIGDPRVTALIPCLLGAQRVLAGLPFAVAAVPAGCQTCRPASRRATTAQDAIQGGAACLSSAPMKAKLQLKQLLDAKQIRYRQTNARGQVAVITF